MSVLVQNKFLSEIEGIVEDNLQNEQFGVEELADQVGMSRSHLHRKLKEETGQSVSQFIREYRLKKARALLIHENLAASEVAYNVGFSSATYFSKAFSDFYGYTPGEAKKSGFEDNNAPISTSTKKKNTIALKILGVVTGVLLIFIAYLLINENQATNNTSQPEKSIVVLPFVNMSNNPEQQHFSAGVMEAILTHLSQINALRVISRTTSTRYKNTDMGIPEIAKELDVSYVLEGGVQEHDGKIRINVQLIKASTDAHVWSKQYDRKLENIFRIQSEIAKNIARSLNARLTKEEIESINQYPTENTVAYEQYLRGKYMIEGNWSLDHLKRSRKYFREAVEQDSNLVEAYVWMAISYLAQGTWYGDLSSRAAQEKAKPYMALAEQIEPNHPLLLWNLAGNKYYFEWDFEKAETYFKKAEATGIRVGYTDFHLDLMLRRFDKVIKRCNETLNKDPYVGTILWNLAYAYYFTNQTDKVHETIARGLTNDPDQEAYYDHFGNLYNAMGMYEQAASLISKGLEISSKRHASMVAHLAISYNKLGKTKKRDELLNELNKRVTQGEPEIKVFLAHAYAGLGKADRAFYWLDESYKAHEVDMLWLQADPNLLLLKEDPRYWKLIEKVGFLEPKSNEF